MADFFEAASLLPYIRCTMHDARCTYIVWTFRVSISKLQQENNRPIEYALECGDYDNQRQFLSRPNVNRCILAAFLILLFGSGSIISLVLAV
mmetsp:Transcript_2089/g.4007  ORF Transcript_2089/g.4007 Transcript_2089/m.4007 type:complete len:92 (-) Transcript_2089:1046-1321(-)